MMNKLSLAIMLLVFPILAMADSSLSFTPPASDYSVVFLGDIFGVVDGVLHGTGSQIMGSMFGVFNAAVLALGGMIIMYTLLVSTMNTAHEGQMLGQKWSSIWIPVRSVAGLALLMPKASGYCLMQVFVMWIVVQGVGAADKVWEAALSYINRGGAIVQAQIDPTKALTNPGGGGAQIAAGAQTMLAGQVCMLGLQNLLQQQLKELQTQKASKTGLCYNATGTPIQAFCDSTVPDFLNSVNFVDIQAKRQTDTSSYIDPTPDEAPFTAPMPNFQSLPYSVLNGICGKIYWKPFSGDDLRAVKTAIKVPDADLKTASLSRVIAIQQMYSDLANLAQVMVSNDPTLSADQTSSSGTTNYSDVAKQQFGVPRTAGGDICTSTSTPNCIIWGSANATTGAPLLNGTEFQNAVADYNGIMLPTLTLVQQAKTQSSAADSRKFIQDANTEGWIMAGSYFFDLINLNVQANKIGDLVDSSSGLSDSGINLPDLTDAFGSSSNAQCNGHYAALCTWLKTKTTVIPILTLINGTGLQDAKNVPIKAPTLNAVHDVFADTASSTVYGYTANATVLQLPGQPGMQPLQFANNMTISVDTSTYQLPEQDFPCGNLKILFWSTCLGSMFGDLIYNYIMRPIYNLFLTLVMTVVNQLLWMYLVIPLQGIASIFKEGLDIIGKPGVNPIVALANMGTYYINFTMNLWLQLITQSILAMFIPYFGLFVFVLMGMAMPLLLAWLTVMVSIGFTTAYYVPMLPYMIFTFGSIAWLMAVIEAMVAAPIVALGVTHPEGHDAFGKGEQAVMILLNVFLRPSMMIIGYIAAIALSYVSVWIINAGFDHAIGFMQGSTQFASTSATVNTPSAGDITGGYSGWAGVYAYFFSVLVYTTLYLTVVTKAFTLISVLPDKVLRWIGGQAETAGQDSAGWAEDTKKQVESGGKESQQGTKSLQKKTIAEASDQLAKLKESMGSEIKMDGFKN